MNVTLTADDLRKFEEDIAECFKQKMIRAPIHLDHSNEQSLIDIFRDFVSEADWVCGTWRTHYRCLLKGVPQEQLKAAILEGRSIGLCFPEYRCIASAIVGGIFPVALGLAAAIKRKGETNKVFCFSGDMSFETGVAHECIKYAIYNELPIVFICEDNDKSVCTPTRKTWGLPKSQFECQYEIGKSYGLYLPNIIYYKYESKFPHAGHGGARIQF